MSDSTSTPEQSSTPGHSTPVHSTPVHSAPGNAMVQGRHDANPYTSDSASTDMGAKEFVEDSMEMTKKQSVFVSGKSFSESTLDHPKMP